MLQLSYWLFPALTLVFWAQSTTRPFLMPGLVAACAAGAANSAVVSNYTACIGHALAAALLLLFRPDASETIATGAAAAWLLLAIFTTTCLPFGTWPYALTESQMLVLFAAFLPAGAVAATTPP